MNCCYINVCQIPESPLRLQVVERQCDEDFLGESVPLQPCIALHHGAAEDKEHQCGSQLYVLFMPGRGMIADSQGDCICPDATIDIGHKCVDVTIFAVIGSILGVILLAIATFYYLRYKNRKNDELWTVHADELHFSEPAEVIGQGSFGVVLLAVSQDGCLFLMLHCDQLASMMEP